MRRVSKLFALALIVYLLPVCSDALGAGKKKAASSSNNRLDQLIAATAANGQPLISSYRIEAGSAYIQMNPSMWNAMTPSEHRQIVDMLARTDVWQSIGVINAWLRVYQTDLGRIRKSWTGDWEFVPGSGW
ncbi:MAG: hypothetical protein WCC53_08300 [Thermoanaerobaculia bacterium]